ncbi:unnamed protein product [Urochloa decumbens]|uniref:Serine protease n=1 Tax=Urochloa decumbens TaxID=240449 RepID=A0ABC9H1Q9_9POAL
MDIEKMVQETFNNYRKSMVLIIKRMDESRTASSGFIIGKKDTSYLVMTCRHCITASSNTSNLRLNVRISGKTKEYEVKVLYDDALTDLAIIQVIDVPQDEECPILQFRSLEATPFNTPIVQLGYLLQSSDILNLEPASSPGTIIMPFYQNGQMSIKDVVYSAATKHGCSGSAVVLDSKVIGVSYTVSLTGHTSFARSSYTVGEVLKNWLQIAPNANMTINGMIDSILEKI